MKNLEDLTIKILKSYDKFTSNDFINLYNIIYLHCTEPTQIYEIKGAVIYELLRKILQTYIKSLRPLTSLKDFLLLSKRLQKSFILLRKAYYYLERFFISVNIKKRGSNVVHLQALFQETFYRYFVFYYMTNIKEFFLYEIQIVREAFLCDMENVDYHDIKECVRYLQDIFFYSGNQAEYEAFLQVYYSSLDLIIRNDKIENLIKQTNTELKIAEKILDFKNKENFLEITKCISENYKKFLQWFFKEKQVSTAEQDCCIYLLKFEKIDKIVYYLEDQYIANFFIRFEPFLINFINKLQNINSLFTFFLDFKNKIKFNAENIEELEKRIEKVIIEKIKNAEGIVDFCSLQINRFIQQRQENYIEIRYLYYIINILEQKHEILKKLERDFLERIINTENVCNLENKNIEFCKMYCGFSSVSWISKIVKIFDTPLQQDFALQTQDEVFKTYLYLIAKDFCNLKAIQINLHPKLVVFSDILTKRFLKKNQKSYILCCQRASSIIIEVAGINIKMSADKVSLLLYIEEECDLDKVKMSCKDTNFFENLNFLSGFGLVKIEGNKAFVIYDRNIIIEKTTQKNDEELGNVNTNILSHATTESTNILSHVTTESTNILSHATAESTNLSSHVTAESTNLSSHVTAESTNLLNLFHFQLQENFSLEKKREDSSTREHIIDSFIVKYIKNKKVTTKSELNKAIQMQYGYNEILLDTYVNKLIDKGYITNKNGELYYVP